MCFYHPNGLSKMFENTLTKKLKWYVENNTRNKKQTHFGIEIKKLKGFTKVRICICCISTTTPYHSLFIA